LFVCDSGVRFQQLVSVQADQSHRRPCLRAAAARVTVTFSQSLVLPRIGLLQIIVSKLTSVFVSLCCIARGALTLLLFNVIFHHVPVRVT
jgi:hypothetical protein